MGCRRSLTKVKVHGDCHVQFELCRYSVPYRLVRQSLWLRATDTSVRVYSVHQTFRPVRYYPYFYYYLLQCSIHISLYADSSFRAKAGPSQRDEFKTACRRDLRSSTNKSIFEDKKTAIEQYFSMESAMFGLQSMLDKILNPTRSL